MLFDVDFVETEEKLIFFEAFVSCPEITAKLIPVRMRTAVIIQGNNLGQRFFFFCRWGRGALNRGKKSGGGALSVPSASGVSPSSTVTN